MFVKTPFSQRNGEEIVARSIEDCSFQLSIIGCEFESYFKLKEEKVYWIKDSVKKIDAYVYLVNDQLPYRYKFSDLYFDRINFIDHGYYQCALNSVSSSIKEVISDQYDLQLHSKKIKFMHLLFVKIYC